MISFFDKLALYRYILRCLYDELHRYEDKCEHCDHVTKVKVVLERVCNEADINIKVERGN